MRPLLSETSFVIVTDLPEMNLSYLQKNANLLPFREV